MKNTKNTILAITILIFAAFTSQAQLMMPAASPAAFVSQQVGFTKISIDYSSPAVNGRKVFGEVVPFGTPWRAGANGATIVEFSTAVNIGGTNLRAGKYAMYITPNDKDAWTVHFNKEQKQIYAYMDDNKVDMDALSKDLAVSINVTPTTTAVSYERLNYSISAKDNKKGTITMTWAYTTFSFDVDVKIEDIIKTFGTTNK
jgi:hypothetical protein